MKHPGRKIYHLAGGIGMLALYQGAGRSVALPLLTGLFCLALLFDIVRLRSASLNAFMFARFGSFIRQNEAATFTGTPAYLAGITLSLLLFSPQVAAAAVCFLACGDVAATAVGERFGRIKIGMKSLEGTAAFVVAALAAGFLLVPLGMAPPPAAIVGGAFIAAGVELLSLPVNDNLLIPLTAGAAMELLVRFAA